METEWGWGWMEMKSAEMVGMDVTFVAVQLTLCVGVSLHPYYYCGYYIIFVALWLNVIVCLLPCSCTFIFVGNYFAVNKLHGYFVITAPTSEHVIFSSFFVLSCWFRAVD